MYENILEPLSIPQSFFSLQSKRRKSPFRAYSVINITLTQCHCSPWKKCNLFIPEIDFSANRNVEIQAVISDNQV